ncbi:hypothetical protein [Campylobacter showae]|uniref:hypothetical protein n=1 Tax=Campylobacter showae TaxID=204 RepID=UPI0028D1BF4C|nr:hypothetical protein [Campylobacter showae]
MTGKIWALDFGVLDGKFTVQNSKSAQVQANGVKNQLPFAGKRVASKFSLLLLNLLGLAMPLNHIKVFA